MKNNIRLLIILIFSLALFSCYGSWNIFDEGNDPDHRADSILKIKAEKDECFKASGVAELNGRYDVLVLTDLHFGVDAVKGPFDSLYEWLDSVKDTPDYPAFVLSLGDSSNVGSKDEFKDYLKFCKKLIEEYNLKIVFNSVGNHDLYQGHWENWEASCYPHTSFYKFETKGFSWYCLDTGSGRVGKKQYESLMNAFSHDSKPKIIFTHYPVTEFKVFGIGMDETTERNLLIDAFVKNKVKTYIAGHNHYKRSDYVGFDAYCCPSFRYNRGWAVLHVNEFNSSAKIELIP